MVSKAPCRLTSGKAQEGSSQCPRQNSRIHLPHPLHVWTSDFHKEQTTPGHPPGASLIPLNWHEGCQARWMPTTHSQFFIKHLLVPEVVPRVLRATSDPLSLTSLWNPQSYVLTCYAKGWAHVTPPGHNPTVPHLRPAPCVFPLLLQSILVDLWWGAWIP